MGVSLQISDYEILKDAGKISHEIAQEKALDEYETVSYTHLTLPTIA